MFSSIPRGCYSNEAISKNFGKEVLLGNWQELRQGSNEPNDCIVPALKRVDACVSHQSEIVASYGNPWPATEAATATRTFLDARNQSLHNFQRNTQVQIRFPLAADMMNNITTTYKLVFDILPGQQRKQTADNPVCSVPGKPQDRDLLLSYGNRSGTGKRRQQREELRVEKMQRLQTEYAAEYTTCR